MIDVDYLVIGAGLCGMVFHRFLDSERCVLVDSRPGRYKIGESIIPEQFRHPKLQALLPAIQALPSYSRKYGTTFISDGRVASFPLPESEVGQAMHCSRHEMEACIRKQWQVPIRTERVTAIDFAKKLVTTDKNTYRVAHQIIDCSGPAMVVASLVDDVQQLWPVFATWAYYDVVDNDSARFFAAARARGWAKMRYDSQHRRVLAGEEIPGWEPGRTTILTRVRDGVWTWQIALHDEKLLSFGAVSRHGKISREDLAKLADNPAPNYTLRPRPHDKSSYYNRLHVRNYFARKAKKAATADYILISDAFAFADPVYSVGTGLAVNKAIEVASVLNKQGWNAEIAETYCKHYDAQIDRAIAGFKFWYTGEVFDDRTAAQIQDKFLVGDEFQVGILEHYGTAVADADLSAKVLRADPFSIDWTRPPLDKPVAELLELQDGCLATWRFVGANESAGGIVSRWTHPRWPDLSLLVSREDGSTLRVMYMNLLEGTYPSSPDLRALLAALRRTTKLRAEMWFSLLP